MSITAVKHYGYPVIYRAIVPTGGTGTEVIYIKQSPLPTANFYYTCQVKDASNAVRAGVTSVYDKTTGAITVGAALGGLDIVTISGSWTTK